MTTLPEEPEVKYNWRQMYRVGIFNSAREVVLCSNSEKGAGRYLTRKETLIDPRDTESIWNYSRNDAAIDVPCSG